MICSITIATNKVAGTSHKSVYNTYLRYRELVFTKYKSRMFIAMSTFTIANDVAPEVKEAFKNRSHLVDNAPGFQKLEVMSPQDNPNEILLLTYWTDAESYQVWYKSHKFQASHKDIPKGLKLVPGSTKIRLFSLIGN